MFKYDCSIGGLFPHVKMYEFTYDLPGYLHFHNDETVIAKTNSPCAILIINGSPRGKKGMQTRVNGFPNNELFNEFLARKNKYK
jgi:hypothetical protein